MPLGSKSYGRFRLVLIKRHLGDVNIQRLQLQSRIFRKMIHDVGPNLFFVVDVRAAPCKKTDGDTAHKRNTEHVSIITGELTTICSAYAIGNSCNAKSAGLRLTSRGMFYRHPMLALSLFLVGQLRRSPYRRTLLFISVSPPRFQATSRPDYLLPQ